LLLAVLPIAGKDWFADVRARGAELEAAHQWAEAAKLYQSTLDHLPADDLNSRFWILTSLGEVNFERRDYAQSERWLHQADQTIRGLPADAPEHVRLLNAWGTLHLVRGNLTAAQQELSRAVELTVRVGRPEDHAAALHNLAALEMNLGQASAAVAHETQALAIWQKQLGERHYYVMKAWIGLSSAQGLLGNWRAAEESVLHALAIGESGEALANYAAVLDKLKRGKEAKAIRLRLKAPLASPPELVDVKALMMESGPKVRSR
jgi:tetratricopeptide (TPR) repeat protein